MNKELFRWVSKDLSAHPAREPGPELRKNLGWAGNLYEYGYGGVQTDFAAAGLQEAQVSFWIQLKQRDGLIYAPFVGGEGPTPKIGQLVDCPVGGRTVQATVSRVSRASGPVSGASRADMVDATEL
jgi:hypothetical protein